MKIYFRLALCVLAVAACFTAITAQAADSLIGTWRLSSLNEEETESKVVHAPFGDHPVGSITFTADERMMVIFTDPGRKPSASPKASETEAAELYRTMVAYAGRYSVDGNKLTNKIEVSWNQAWNGTSQMRFFEVKDGRLTIKTQAFVSPFLNKQIVATLIFDRVN
jgi:Lipocalin-like domain